MEPVTIVCIKVGDKYGYDYVNKLQSMVTRHTTLPFRFACLTDDPRGVVCDEIYTPETDLKGWWAKLVLFKPHSMLLNRQLVFLDLDTIIVGNVDFLLEYRGPLCVNTDCWAPTYSSAIMSLQAGAHTDIWTRFMEKPLALTQIYHGDQDWMTACLQQVPALWPMGRIGSYKADKLEAGPKAFSIVNTHGYPKPHQIASPWVVEAWK